MTNNRKGTIAEAIAVSWLLLEGYEVYKNVSAWGKVDIIALKDGIATFIDVAFCCKQGNNHHDPKLAHSRRELNIRYLYVLDDRNCKWRDEMMKTEKRQCIQCKREFEVKDKSTRKFCNKHCNIRYNQVANKIPA